MAQSGERWILNYQEELDVSWKPWTGGLSPKACRGILRRAEKRGKKLPVMLKIALDLQAGLQAECILRERYRLYKHQRVLTK